MVCLAVLPKVEEVKDSFNEGYAQVKFKANFEYVVKGLTERVFKGGTTAPTMP